MTAPTRMFSEAGEAPGVARALLAANAGIIERLAARLRAAPPRAVVTMARGSSDNAATYARYLIETRLGVLTSSAPPSVSSVYHARTDMRDMLMLAVSQSGRSPDLVTAARTAHEAGAYVAAFVNAGQSPLADAADIVAPLHAGPEISVAATKSFIAAQVALLQLVAAWSQDAELTHALATLPDLLARAWNADWSAGMARLVSARGLYVIGRGVGFGAAQEAALKMKEACGLHAEAFSAAEVAHGPMALAKDGFPVLLLAQDDETREGMAELAAKMVAQGADVIAAGIAPEGTTILPSVAAHPAIAPILLVQSFYRMAEALSRARGLDPDTPPFLKKVTETI